MNAPRLVSEFLQLYPWKVDYVLSLSSVRFFTLLDEGQKARSRRDNLHYSELCDIMAIPMSGKEYYNHLKACYMRRLDGVDAPEKDPLDAAAPSTGKALTAILGGHRG